MDMEQRLQMQNSMNIRQNGCISNGGSNGSTTNTVAPSNNLINNNNNNSGNSNNNLPECLNDPRYQYDHTGYPQQTQQQHPHQHQQHPQHPQSQAHHITQPQHQHQHTPQHQQQLHLPVDSIKSEDHRNYQFYPQAGLLPV